MDRIEFSGPGQFLRRAALYDLLVWQQRRIAVEIADALPADVSSLLAAASAYRRAADAIPMQPPISELAAPGIEIESPQQLDLASRQETEFPVTVTNRRDHAVDIWLVADFDPRLMTLEARDKGILYDEANLRHLPVAAAGESERRIGTGIRCLPISVPSARHSSCKRGKPKPSGWNCIVEPLPAATPGWPSAPSTDADDVRRELTVVLPHRLSVDLVAEGIADSWRSEDAVLTLYPFPNRTTPYTLYLVNAGSAERTVDLEDPAGRESPNHSAAAGRYCRQRGRMITSLDLAR